MYKLQTHIGFTNLWSNMPTICVISSQRVKNVSGTPCRPFFFECGLWGRCNVWCESRFCRHVINHGRNTWGQASPFRRRSTCRPTSRFGRWNTWARTSHFRRKNTWGRTSRFRWRNTWERTSRFDLSLVMSFDPLYNCQINDFVQEICSKYLEFRVFLPDDFV